jgi:diguanylate cyclase (GGDEF)-like protein
VISTDSKTRIGELENTLELARNEKALAESAAANRLQRAENEALQASESRARAINLALLAGLIAAAAVLALLWRNYRIRTRSHRELRVRNVEIEEQRAALQRLNSVIHQQSREDALTGLGNRRQFLESLTTSGSAEAGVLVMADLDHFKAINDTHGHDIGDLALKLFADVMRDVGRDGDLLVRWGGEEFIWLCRGAAFEQGAALCERLLAMLRDRSLNVGGRALLISASLGYVPLPIWPGTATDWDSALKIADYAVYCSKASGRGGWTGFVGVGAPEGIAGATPAAMEERGWLRRVESASTKIDE